MRPIEEKADVTTMQALRCVEFRVPAPLCLERSGHMLALSLRYGLVGVAAFHHLLIHSFDDEEELEAMTAMEAWGDVVEDHVRWEVRPRLAMNVSDDLPEMVGRFAQESLGALVPLYRRLYPLERSLELLAAKFITDHRPSIERSWNPLVRRRRAAAFRHLAADSVYFACGFFDRRQDDLQEVPEIALIGE